APRAALPGPSRGLARLGAGSAHVLDRRDLGEPLRILRQTVEERGIEFLVDQPGARTLDLVAHAARAEDHDSQVLVPALDRLLDRLAQVVAAIAGRRRILDDVDRDRDHADGPL